MRKIQKLIALLVLILVSSCAKEEIQPDTSIEENSVITKNSNLQRANQYGNGIPVYSHEKLIIQFKPETPEFIKDIYRSNNGIATSTGQGNGQGQSTQLGTYEICKCENRDIELWDFKTPLISIEPKKEALSGDDLGKSYGIPDDMADIYGIEDVDYEYTFGLDEFSYPDVGSVSEIGYSGYVRNTNSGLTVAVLDTGIAPDLSIFPESGPGHRFLYNASDTALNGEETAWDFANNDSSPFDDDPFKHGSSIAKQLTSMLRNRGIQHQILPIKIANEAGIISNFALICGTLRATELAEVINMSFGWYNDGFGDFGNTILENILTVNDDVIVVASAGNKNSNNDSRSHFPSGLELPNVISVGSCDKMYEKVSEFSNYGANTVHFFAKGEGYPFYDSFLKGTSFAAPQVTAEVVKILDDGGSTNNMAFKIAQYEGVLTSDYFIAGVNSFTGLPIQKNTIFNKYITLFE